MLGGEGAGEHPLRASTAPLTALPPNPCRKLSRNEGFEGKWEGPDKAEEGPADQHPISSAQPQPSSAISHTLEGSSPSHELLGPALNPTLPPLGKGPTYGSRTKEELFAPLSCLNSAEVQTRAWKERME